MKYTKREVRNNIVLNLQKIGASQKVIGEMVNLSQQMISKILGKQAIGLPLTTKSSGYKRRLSDEQLASLPKLLEQGAEFYEFTGDYWTHERVRYVIEKEYNIVYEVKQVGRIVALINWTRQKPQKKEAKQDEQKVEKWKTEGLPRLKKKAEEEGYELILKSSEGNIKSFVMTDFQIPIQSVFEEELNIMTLKKMM